MVSPFMYLNKQHVFMVSFVSSLSYSSCLFIVHLPREDPLQRNRMLCIRTLYLKSFTDHLPTQQHLSSPKQKSQTSHFYHRRIYFVKFQEVVLNIYISFDKRFFLYLRGRIKLSLSLGNWSSVYYKGYNMLLNLDIIYMFVQ